MTAIGVVLDRSQILRADAVVAAARHVEDLQLDGLFVGDHLAGVMPMLDGTMLLAVAAAATERIALGFAVMVPALRHVAWAAKQITTLQHLSGERVVVGVGTGAAVHGPSAWDALDIPYASRGSHLEAVLGALPDLIAGEEVRLGAGSPLALAPAATVPPIWVAGNSRRTVRRAALHGDGWLRR